MGKKSYLKKGVAAEFDQLFVSTMDKMNENKVFDQYFRDRPMLAFLLERRDAEMFAGAEQYQETLEIGENPHGGWIGFNEGVSMDDYDPFNGVQYWPKALAYNLTHTWEQQRVNRGKSMIFKLVEKKIENTRKTIMKLLSTGVWTGAGGSSKEMDGLPNLIPATVPASQSTAVGGVSPSTHSWWRTQGINMNGESSTAALENNMLTMYNNIVAEGGRPTLIACDQTTHESYEKNALDYVLYKPTRIADVTFELCQYKGIGMTFDKDAPSGELRMISGEDLAFGVDPEYWFATTGWKEGQNVPYTKNRQVVCVCNLVRHAARTHGCIFNISE